MLAYVQVKIVKLKIILLATKISAITAVAKMSERFSFLIVFFFLNKKNRQTRRFSLNFG